jgi:hypothetical protein
MYSKARTEVNRLDNQMKKPLVTLEQKIDICFKQTKVLGECRVYLNNDKNIKQYYAKGYASELDYLIDRVTKKRLELQSQLQFLNAWLKNS